jgi:hypothetical protein
MKKKILFISTFLFICFALCGCTLKKNTITMEHLQEVSIAKEYEFMDITEQFQEDERIQNVGMVASNYWHLEYYLFDNEESAMETFESNKKTFLTFKGNTSSEEESHFGNYETYGLTTITEYMYICRVENTLVFARVPVEYRSNVKSFVKNIGY